MRKKGGKQIVDSTRAFLTVFKKKKKQAFSRGKRHFLGRWQFPTSEKVSFKRLFSKKKGLCEPSLKRKGLFVGDKMAFPGNRGSVYTTE